ncbi:D-sedoheptulose-7-phosphate isomerase [Sinorhizobium fredii]|uniref:D-sedoheptulose-7-phosphate isomerase n=1 Tax=Rhizobium fredii TaxID=380 RepID=UPI00210943FF|nr:SIS domain-containing protein [Sinorhizobium fredii]UTY46688.1 SIS domain-containing protein [Sinorhizobium fredii]
MTDAKDFFTPYFAEYQRLAFDSKVFPIIEDFADLALDVRNKGKKLMFAGNGASASIAEHGAVDFTKQGKVRGITFHDPNLMTCFANDFGYDHWVAKAIEHHADDGDVAVLISVSGQSPSVVNAARYAKDRGMRVVAFTGRKPDNPLAQSADLNFFVASDAYNIVENIHSIWLTTTVDYVIGKAIYETRAYQI